MVKKSENLEKSQKIALKKIYENFEREKKFRPKKNAIPLVLPIEEISLRPELSSPPRFRIQGGSPERDTRTEILVSNIGLC